MATFIIEHLMLGCFFFGLNDEIEIEKLHDPEKGHKSRKQSSVNKEFSAILICFMNCRGTVDMINRKKLRVLIRSSSLDCIVIQEIKLSVVPISLVYFFWVIRFVIRVLARM